MDKRDTPQPPEPPPDVSVDVEAAPPEAPPLGADTVGTGSAIALGCVVVTLILILLGVLFFLILWLVA